MKHYTRVLARVDLDAVEYNIEMMKKNIQKDTQMMAVIKMDGYGHGAFSGMRHMRRRKTDRPFIMPSACWQKSEF